MKCWEHRPFPKLPAVAGTVTQIMGQYSVENNLLKQFMSQEILLANKTLLNFGLHETVTSMIDRPITWKKWSIQVGSSCQEGWGNNCFYGFLDVLGVNLRSSRFRTFQISTLLHQPQQCPAKFSHIWTCRPSPAITWWSKTYFLGGTLTIHGN